MAHCIIWITHAKDLEHLEINLETIPRVGELIGIEDNDDEEEEVELVVESVKHSLILTEGKWKQLIDISARKTALALLEEEDDE